MRSGSGNRPGPVSAPVSRPESGSRMVTPRERRVATLATVAGCNHISVCMAGTMSTGQVAVSSTLPSRSGASPAAARASESAVAGATTTRSASRPRRTWLTDSTASKVSVRTGRPERASQVARPTKFRAAGVGTTSTRCPASVIRRSSRADL